MQESCAVSIRLIRAVKGSGLAAPIGGGVRAGARRRPGTLRLWSDPFITWPPHPDDHVQELFRQANRDGFVIVHLGGMYTLISPDGTQEMQFQDYVVPSSGAWQVVVRQLESWLKPPADQAHDAARGQVVYLTEHGERLAAIVPVELAAELENLTPQRFREKLEDFADARAAREALTEVEAGAEPDRLSMSGRSWASERDIWPVRAGVCLVSIIARQAQRRCVPAWDPDRQAAAAGLGGSGAAR